MCSANTKGEYFITSFYPIFQGKTIFNKRINTTGDAVILMDLIYMKKAEQNKWTATLRSK